MGRRREGVLLEDEVFKARLLGRRKGWREGEDGVRLQGGNDDSFESWE